MEGNGDIIDSNHTLKLLLIYFKLHTIFLSFPFLPTCLSTNQSKNKKNDYKHAFKSKLIFQIKNDVIP